MMKTLTASLACLLAVTVAACGGESTTTPSPAAEAPAVAPTADAGPVVPAADAGTDADEPLPPGPSFVAQPAELMINHPAMPGGQSPFYEVRLDEATPEGGAPSSLLASLEGADSSTWAATTTVRLITAASALRRYRMRAKVKTEAAGGAFLWLRIDRSGNRFVLDNMGKPASRRLTGTNAWAEIALVLDVPDDAKRFAFGAGLIGTGKVWIGAITLEEVGTDVETTPHYTGP